MVMSLGLLSSTLPMIEPRAIFDVAAVESRRISCGDICHCPEEAWVILRPCVTSIGTTAFSSAVAKAAYSSPSKRDIRSRNKAGRGWTESGGIRGIIRHLACRKGIIDGGG